jgi:UPF0148 protein
LIKYIGEKDQAMKSEDEIMAECLLKGGKMLSKTCPACGCPLFEYRGETLCVVCREEQAGPKGGKGHTGEKGAAAQKTGTREGAGKATGSDLSGTLDETLAALAVRVRDEPDPERVLILMNAIKKGIEARNLLS